MEFATMPATLSPAIMMGEIAAAIQVLKANFPYFVTIYAQHSTLFSPFFCTKSKLLSFEER
jgi:hypothetical protein